MFLKLVTLLQYEILMDNLFGIKDPMIFESAPNFNVKLKWLC